jgi:hypothetical protein
LRRGTAKLQYKSDAPSSTPPFAPSDISGLQLWFDGADAATITLDGSNNVEQWNDKSGNARHASQASTTRRPSSSSINGLFACGFDGIDDRLGTAAFTLAQPTTVFIVGKVGDSGTRVLYDSNTNRNQVRIETQLARTFAGTFLSSASPTTGTTNPFLVKAVFNGASSSIRTNKTASASGNAGTSGMSGGLAIGISAPDNLFPFLGQIGEIITYDSVLSAGDITSVETYLSSKWGTP